VDVDNDITDPPRTVPDWLIITLCEVQLMRIMEGYSDNPDACAAIEQVTAGWDSAWVPDILFVFHSMSQQAEQVSARLAERFPDSLIAGATTAGEWAGGAVLQNSLVLLGIRTPDIRWSVIAVDKIDRFDAGMCASACASLLQQLRLEPDDLHPDRFFCLSLIDGLSQREESVSELLSAQLAGVPLLGGSAADGMTFKGPYVHVHGRAMRNAGVLVLAECKRPFATFKHQHFVPGEIDTVISKADISHRTVYHLDGLPAAERFAELIGKRVDELDAALFAAHPLIYRTQGECYVRSIGQVGESNSLVFYSAVEEGMILNLCSHCDMQTSLARQLATIREEIGGIELLLFFNCTLRRLESDQTESSKQMADMMQAAADHAVGFDTYGEQWQGLHINQTLVGLAL